MRSSELIEGALALLGPNGENWVKGSDIHLPSKLCIVLAIAEMQPTVTVFRQAKKYLAKAAGLKPNENQSLAIWNDQDHIQWSDIKRAMETAAQAAKEQGD